MKDRYPDITEELQERTDNADSLLTLIAVGNEYGREAANAGMVLCEYIDRTADMIASALNDRKEAGRMYREHRKAFEDWQEGGPAAVWRDEDGRLCIRYESGKWWHYRRTADGNIEWW